MQEKPFFIMLAVMLGIFLASIDALVVGTAMPTVVRELGGLHLYGWIFNAYILASALTMPLFGKLSDTYPMQYVYALCVGIFLLGSALCGTSQSIIQLILFRAVQGLGAGGMFSVPFAIIGAVFEPRHRGKMIGYTSTVWGISSILGPLLGSIIVTQFSWRWVFYINIPVGVIAVIVLLLVYRQPFVPKSLSIDYSGLIVLGLAITSVLLSFVHMSQISGFSLIGAALIVLGVLSFIGFYYIEKKNNDPIVTVELLSDPHYIIADICALIGGAVIFAIIAFIPFLVQTLKGGSPIQAGGILMPIAMSWSATSIIIGHFLSRIPARIPVIGGFIMFIIGLGCLLCIDPETPFWFLIFSVFNIGVGAGLQTPALLVAVQNSASLDKLGEITSTQQLFSRIGGVIGIGLTGAVFGMMLYHFVVQAPSAAGLGEGELRGILSKPHQLLNSLQDMAVISIDKHELLDAFLHAFKYTFIINLCMSIIGCILAFFIPHKRIPQN